MARYSLAKAGAAQGLGLSVVRGYQWAPSAAIALSATCCGSSMEEEVTLTSVA